MSSATEAHGLAAKENVSLPFPIKPSTDDGSSTNPTPPPQMESVRSHTADEIVKMMGRTPLFMNSLDQAGAEDEDNDALDALRALQYDGTPAENAQSFKEQGNELVQVKKWSDAKEFYTKGIAVLSGRIGEKRGDHGDGNATEEREKESRLEEACYVNRALCNLELRNYRSTTLDCRSALRLNAKNIKAFYRSAQALFALHKLAEATDACQHGLALDAENTALKELSLRIAATAAQVKAEDNRKRKQAVMLQRQKFTLAAALKARKIKTRKSAQPPEMEDATIHLAPDPLSPESTLQFPVILLYPMHAQSDFIKAFAETDTVSMHLDYIFPLPWDEKHEYLANQVELYMETASGGLVKVGKNVSLLKTLSSDVEIVDELVRINVVPKGLSRQWVDELRERMKKYNNRTLEEQLVGQ